MERLDPLLLIGLDPEQAEARLRQAGVRQVQRVETAPPRRQGPAGAWRVIRCRWPAEETAELTVARGNQPHPTVQAALSVPLEGI